MHMDAWMHEVAAYRDLLTSREDDVYADFGNAYTTLFSECFRIGICIMSCNPKSELPGCKWGHSVKCSTRRL